MKERVLLFFLVLLAAVASGAAAAEQAVQSDFSGKIGEKHLNVLNSRVYPLIEPGNAIYAEAVNAFRTCRDDVNQQQGLWQGEYWGKTMLSLAQAAHGHGDERLKRAVREMTLDFIEEFQASDGYISTYSNRYFVCQYRNNGYCWNLWGQKYTLWALIEAYKTTGERRILEAAEKMASQQIDLVRSLPVRIVDTGCFAGMPSMSVLKPMVLLYEVTGKERYMDWAREIVSIWDEDGGCPNLVRNGIVGRDVHTWYPEPQKWAKAYEMMSCVEGLIAYSRAAGEDRALAAAKGIAAALKHGEMNVLGSVGYFDHFTNAAAQNNAVSEGCDIVHWMRLCLDLEDFDALEDAFCNAFLASVYRDGAWGAHAVRSAGFSHYSAPHQVGMKLHQCCIDNYPRGFRDVLDRRVVRKGDVFSINTYFAGSQKFSDGVEFVFRGEYPLAEEIEVQVTTPRAIEGVLRNPGWNTEQLPSTFAAGPGTSTFRLRFGKRARVVHSANPAREFDRKDWRRGFYTFYWDRDGCEAGFRSTPAATVKYGPIVLARCQASGSAEGLDGFETLNHLPDVQVDSIEPVPALDGAWGMWKLRLRADGGKVVKEYTVCDFASAADTKSTNNWFSVWF